MKRRCLPALLACALLALCSCAAAQELPSNAVFSPGLKRLAQMDAALPLEAQAQVEIGEAMYARDLSVLSQMLEGTTITYSRAGQETLAFARGGETLGVYALPESGQMDALEEALSGAAVLERVPLAAIADWLEGLEAGDALVAGFCVSEPFALERTMSDDGTRLTKIRVTGAIARGEDAPYRVEGFLRQPAGRAPKDTFELTFTQDEENTLELLYSALRENEVTRKNREGTASVRTTLKAAGKLGGYGISSRLSVTMKNRWTADGDALDERITISAALSHQDKTPGRRMQRLNDASAEAKHALRLKTHEAGDETIALSDEISLSIVLDGHTLVDAGAEVTIRVPGDTAVSPMPEGELDDASARALAQRLYRQLDENAKEKIQSGL